ncbi:MAG: lysophospholipid acyltransferase family protein [Candidatus Helarchaeota archaeon]
MFYDLRKIMSTRQILDNEDETFYFLNVRFIKPIVKLIKLLGLNSFLQKIPKSFLNFISQGVSHVIAGNEEYQMEIYKVVERIMGEVIEKKFPSYKKEYIIERIIYQNLINMSLVFYDMIFLLPYLIKYRNLKKYFSFTGLEHVNNALKKGNGVIIVSDHIGNFLLLFCIFSLLGYKTNAIIEIQNYLGIIELLKETGLKIIPSPPSNNEKLKSKIKSRIETALKNNELLIILQDFGSQHYLLMNFLNELCYTPIGVISLSIKHKSPILPAFIKSYTDRHFHELTIYPEYKIIKFESMDKSEVILYNCHIINKIIERHIKENFLHWMILPAYHIRKLYRINEKYKNRSFKENFLETMDYYKELIENSYEPGRNNEDILKILTNITNEVKKETR